MIIIEGPDTVGKTVFATAIADRLGMRYQHLSRLPDTFHRFHDYLPMIKPDVVYDRFHVSEIAYSYARGEPESEWRMKPSYYYALDRMLLKRAAIIVIITAEPHVITERFQRLSAREMYSVDAVLRANEAYIKMANGNFFDYSPYCHLHCHLHGVNEYPGEELIEVISGARNILRGVSSFLSSTSEFRVL